jgi:hypothetical protein
MARDSSTKASGESAGISTVPFVSRGHLASLAWRRSGARSPARAPEIVEVLRTEEKGSEPLRVVGSALGRTPGIGQAHGAARDSAARSRRASIGRFHEATLLECRPQGPMGKPRKKRECPRRWGEGSFRWDLDVS